MSLNWEVVPSIKQKKRQTVYQRTKQVAHTTNRGKGKVATALKGKKP